MKIFLVNRRNLFVLYCNLSNFLCHSWWLWYFFDLGIFLFLTCSTVLFADPTDEEENLLTGVVTVVVTDDDKIAAVHKPGENLYLLPKCTISPLQMEKSLSKKAKWPSLRSLALKSRFIRQLGFSENLEDIYE